MTETNGSGPVADENGSAPTEDAAHTHEPHIQILRGEPTAEELAALVAVLGCAGGAPEPEQPERTRWGLPVDRLRFAMTNYQRLTFQQMTHMRH
ncbi:MULTISPECIES: acyl-CoA carboxylase subunit epsilon [Mycobacterium]|uniref:Acyl-CoA carboxylase subunit epsilon n=1 Tax=Mycobacterium colombiense TaxID=339268 RepID=A0A329LMC3_9MYCO|nr:MULTISPECIES: acyl-CoA carboxylase subunit epsilon [Mycobacterium]MDM4140817.1 acyl-CoA carboxylase subunit epsilon [Mycobacterium sp. FLAC0960]RAV07883.1 acyl-CoA carboxylase subunit epsilon [Mycobacterium colombiense]